MTSTEGTAPVAAGAAEPEGGGGRAVRAGRPRDDAREQAILDAALGVLAETGYDRMSMDAVANRARASKATIYRRWPGKAELVAEALCRRSAVPPVPDTGTLRGDLLAVVRHVCTALAGTTGGLMCGLANAIASDPGLAAVVEREMLTDKVHLAETIVARAVDRGELPRNADPGVLHEVPPALALQRRLRALPLDEVFAVHVVDDVLLPLLNRSGATERPSSVTPRRSK